MVQHAWLSIPVERMSPLVSRQVLHTGSMTVARIFMKKGAVVPLHHHVNEQITMLEEGRLRFVIEGVESEIRGGEMMQIQPNAPHLVEALEDSVATDLFSPVREDWIRGDDAYLRR